MHLGLLLRCFANLLHLIFLLFLRTPPYVSLRSASGHPRHLQKQGFAIQCAQAGAGQGYVIRVALVTGQGLEFCRLGAEFLWARWEAGELRVA